MEDDELPPEPRSEGDEAAPDSGGRAGVAVDGAGPDVDRPARPPAAREPRAEGLVEAEAVHAAGIGAEAVDVGPGDPGPVEAGSVEAGSVEAGSVEAGSVEAGSVEAASVEPESIDAGPVESVIAGVEPKRAERKPLAAEPDETESAEAEPDETESAEAESVQAEPAEAESVQAEPAQAESPERLDERGRDEGAGPKHGPGLAPALQRQLLPGDPEPLPERTVARGRLGHAMRPRATRAQLLAGALCALLGFALVVQARQTQTQGLDSLRQADLVRLLDNVTNAEARAEQDVRDEQAIRDRLVSGTDSSAAAQEAAQKRLDTLGLLAGTVPASGPGIELEITDPRRQVDAPTLLDTLEELRDGGAEVIQIGPVRVVASTAFTDQADGIQVDEQLLTPPYTFKVIGEPQTLARLLQIPGGVLDVLHSKGADGKVTQPPTVTVDALRAPTRPQYARPAPGATP
jgi:uncharacterized protein YlxW (UPF0749 family)